MKYYSANYLEYLTDSIDHGILKLIYCGFVNHVHVLVLWKVTKCETIAKKVYYNQNKFSPIQSFV